MKNIFKISIFLILLLAVTNLNASVKAIVGCNIVNPEGYISLENAVIIIEGNKIIKIGKKGEIAIPENAEVINADGKWVIPGLIDSHVHFFQSGGLYTRPDIINLKEFVPYDKEMKEIQDNLFDTFRRYLRCGITSVVDMGGPYWNFEVRKKANNTKLAPRVKIAGPLISTHHPVGLETDDQPIIKVNTIDEALAEVHKQIDEGTDFIKIWYVVRTGHTWQEYFDLVKATVDESHKLGYPVIIHATALETAKASVRAGADILAHMVYDKDVDDEFINLCKENNVIVSTTCIVSEGYLEALSNTVTLNKYESQLSNPFVIKTLLDLDIIPGDVYTTKGQDYINLRRSRIETAKRNTKKMYDSRVIIAANTDAGNIGTVPGPSIFREFELLKEAGLSPSNILTAVTINGAKLMGSENEIGSVSENKLADLVILNSDPSLDILNTADINRVIKDGNIYTPNEIIAKTPGQLIQQQVNAYNAGDIDNFMETFHPEIKVYNYPNDLRFDNKADKRAAYKQLFDKYPNNHAEIVERMTIGNFVIDKEKVTGRGDAQPRYVIALYEIKDGLIYRVYFMK